MFMAAYGVSVGSDLCDVNNKIRKYAQRSPMEQLVQVIFFVIVGGMGAAMVTIGVACTLTLVSSSEAASIGFFSRWGLVVALFFFGGFFLFKCKRGLESTISKEE